MYFLVRSRLTLNFIVLRVFVLVPVFVRDAFDEPPSGTVRFPTGGLGVLASSPLIRQTG